MKTAILSAVSTAAFAMPPVLGQDNKSEPEILSSPIRISVVAIGDAPQPKFNIVDGKRELIDTPESDYPPGSLFFKGKGGKSEEFTELPIGLNTPTGYISYEGETTLRFFRVSGDGEENPYASMPIPKLTADMTILLTRDRKTNSWESEPQVKLLDNSFAAFPPDSARIINLSAVPVRVLLDSDTKLFELKPGAHRVILLKRSKQGTFAYRTAAAVEDKIFPLTESATTYSEDNRINLVAYNSDGEGRENKPVKFIRYFERPPEPAKKEE